MTHEHEQGFKAFSQFNLNQSEDISLSLFDSTDPATRELHEHSEITAAVKQYRLTPDSTLFVDASSNEVNKRSILKVRFQAIQSISRGADLAFQFGQQEALDYSQARLAQLVSLDPDVPNLDFKAFQVDEDQLEANLSRLARNRRDREALIRLEFASLSIPPALLDDTDKVNPNLAGDGSFDASLYKTSFPLDLGFSNDYFRDTLNFAQGKIDDRFIRSVQPDHISDNFASQGVFIPSLAPLIKKVKVPCTATSGLQGNAVSNLFTTEILCVMTVKNIEGRFKPIHVDIGNFEPVNKDEWVEVHLVDLLWTQDPDSPAEVTLSVSEMVLPEEHLSNPLHATFSEIDNLHLLRHSSRYLIESITVDLGSQASSFNYIDDAVSASVLQNQNVQVVANPLPVMSNNVVGQKGIVVFEFEIDFFLFEKDGFVVDLGSDFEFESPVYNLEKDEIEILKGTFWRIIYGYTVETF